MANRHPILQWFLTYPQCSETKETLRDHLLLMGATEYLVCRELHEDGNPHLHAYAKFDTGFTMAQAVVEFDLPNHHGNYQACRSWRAAQQYIKKDGDYISNIDIQSAKAKRGKRNFELATVPIQDLLESGEICYLQVPALKKARLIMAQETLTATQADDIRGAWFYGPPGTGKSRTARELYPEAYIKAENKWWDGYTGQSSVILDDMDTNCLGHYLKIWGDRYPCFGEIKGGQVPLQHSHFVVTSNYTPEQLWPDNPQMVEAIRRRFPIRLFSFNPITNPKP